MFLKFEKLFQNEVSKNKNTEVNSDSEESLSGIIQYETKIKWQENSKVVLKRADTSMEQNGHIVENPRTLTREDHDLAKKPGTPTPQDLVQNENNTGANDIYDDDLDDKPSDVER